MGEKMERRYKIVCLTCKKEGYAYHYNARYCSNECRMEAQKKHNLEYLIRKKQFVKSKKENGKVEITEKKKTISEIAAEARKHGMSYGMYVDYLRQQGVRT